MRIFLAILSGFCLTLAVFGIGAATTVAFLTTEPEPDRTPAQAVATTAWSDKVVTVKSAAAHEPDDVGLQAGPEKPDDIRHVHVSSIDRPMNDREPADTAADDLIDPTTTAATSPDAVATFPEPAPEPAHELSAAHVEWCLRRYRSYDPSDNRYNAYSGARPECISPYSDTMAGSDLPEEPESAAFVNAAHSDEMPSAYLDAEHIQSCFQRYRSYRPEDNSYQPYGGGPRQQCE